MGPNNINDQGQLPKPTPESQIPPAEPTRPPITVQSQKPSKNKLPYIIGGLILAIIIGVSVAYFIYNNGKTTANNDKDSTSKTDNSTVGSITRILLDDISGESTVTKTDDNNLANDANDDASNVGDSVDENGLK